MSLEAVWGFDPDKVKRSIISLTRLKFEQLHLHLRKSFPARSISFDPHEPQLLFQHTNPQLRML